MENILPFIPALLAAVLAVVKLRTGKPSSWKLALAPLALYAVPVLMYVILFVGVMFMLLKLICRIPGMKLILGVPMAAATATLAGLAVWARKMFIDLKK